MITSALGEFPEIGAVLESRYGLVTVTEVHVVGLVRVRDQRDRIWTMERMPNGRWVALT